MSETKRDGAAQADDGPDARFGPLRLARYKKDDGRALILYSREPDGGEPDRRGPT